MAHNLPADYASALKKIAEDSGVRSRLQADPVGTLKSLGVSIPPEAEAQVRAAHAAPGTSAWVSVAVQVATSPVVSVAVSADIKDKK